MRRRRPPASPSLTASQVVTAFVPGRADQPAALSEAARVLRPEGFLQFSILHPCFVPPFRRVVRNADGTSRAVELADYFVEADGSIEEWWFPALDAGERRAVSPFRIPRFHRTLSSWFAMLTDAVFVVDALAEPRQRGARRGGAGRRRHPRRADIPPPEVSLEMIGARRARTLAALGLERC